MRSGIRLGADRMSGNVSLINGHIDEKADCSKCATKCRYKHWFEHEMRVKEYGCNNFKSKEKMGNEK